MRAGWTKGDYFAAIDELFDVLFDLTIAIEDRSTAVKELGKLLNEIPDDWHDERDEQERKLYGDMV